MIRVPGRQLFEATRGATVLLDPNETGTTVYPEEIRALLDEDQVAVAPVRGHADAVLSPAESRDHWIASLFASAVADIPEVEAVHLAQAHPPGDTALIKALVVIVAVSDALAERVARDLAVALASKMSPRPPRMDVETQRTRRPTGWRIRGWPRFGPAMRTVALERTDQCDSDTEVLVKRHSSSVSSQRAT